MKFLRKILGAVFVGPVVGLSVYLFTPAALFMAAFSAGLAFFAFSASLSSMIACSLLAHTATIAAETLYNGLSNRRFRQSAMSHAESLPNDLGILKGFAFLGASHVSYDNTPISKACLWGFSAANNVAGEGNHIYGENAEKLVEFLDGTYEPKPQTRFHSYQ